MPASVTRDFIKANRLKFRPTRKTGQSGVGDARAGKPKGFDVAHLAQMRKPRRAEDARAKFHAAQILQLGQIGHALVRQFPQRVDGLQVLQRDKVLQLLVVEHSVEAQALQVGKPLKRDQFLGGQTFAAPGKGKVPEARVYRRSLS